MKLAGLVMRRPWLFRLMGRMARWLVPKLPRFLVYNRWNAWGRQRELPEFPRRSFRELIRKRNDR